MVNLFDTADAWLAKKHLERPGIGEVLPVLYGDSCGIAFAKTHGAKGTQMGALGFCADVCAADGEVCVCCEKNATLMTAAGAVAGFIGEER